MERHTPGIQTENWWAATGEDEAGITLVSVITADYLAEPGDIVITVGDACTTWM